MNPIKMINYDFTSNAVIQVAFEKITPITILDKWLT